MTRTDERYFRLCPLESALNRRLLEAGILVVFEWNPLDRFCIKCCSFDGGRIFYKRNFDYEQYMSFLETTEKSCIEITAEFRKNETLWALEEL